MSTLGRAEIIWELRRVMGMTDAKASKCVTLVFRTVRAALESGDNVQIHSFGTLKIVLERGRSYRNRKTGKAMRTRSRKRLEFKPAIGFTLGKPNDI